MQVLKEADPADKAEACSRPGVTLTYHLNERRLAAEARPASIMHAGAAQGASSPRNPWFLTAEFVLGGGNYW
jgi:hypothetical protein